MAWPFSSVAAPNKDSGFIAPPTDVLASPTNFDAVTQFWLLGVHFANPNNADVFVTLTDGSGAVIIPQALVPANSDYDRAWEFLPTIGLMWLANGALTGKAWGYA